MVWVFSGVNLEEMFSCVLGWRESLRTGARGRESRVGVGEVNAWGQGQGLLVQAETEVKTQEEKLPFCTLHSSLYIYA